MLHFNQPTMTLKNTLRWSNKLLKAWYLRNAPVAATSKLEKAEHDHQQYLAKMAELKNTYYSKVGVGLLSEDEKYAALMAGLSLEQSKQQQPATDNQLKSAFLIQQMQAVMQQYKETKVFDEFAIYLYVEDTDDNDLSNCPTDIEVSQKEALKQITQAMQNPEKLHFADREALMLFYANVNLVAQKTQVTMGININCKPLMDWVKLARHIFDVAKALSLKENLTTNENHFVETANTVILYHAMLAHFSIASIFLEQASTDMDLLIAENFIQTSENLYKKCLKSPHLHRIFESQDVLHNTLYALYAKINMKNGDVKSFEENIQQLKPCTTLTQPELDAYCLAGNFYQKSSPKQSLFYYAKAIAIFEKARKSVVSSLRESTYIQMSQVEANCLAIKKSLLAKVRESLREHFSMLKIRSNTPDSLILFYPLEALPATDAVLFKLQQKGLKFEKMFENPKGLQFTTNSFKAEEIVESLRHFLNVANKKSKALPLPASKPELIAAIPKPVNLPSPSTISSNQKVRLIEEPEAPYVKLPERVKEKTHKTAPIAAIAIPAAIAPTVCHAADFGFTDPTNPLVTPVYCSEAAQQKRRAKLFVSFKGIEGVDKGVEDQFKAMLNPHPEGILTVGIVNQAGAKLWKHPDALGGSWNLCALRFKRKGAAGWLRAVTVPEEKVTIINSEGKEENHYLFSLGKPVHK